MSDQSKHHAVNLDQEQCGIASAGKTVLVSFIGAAMLSCWKCGESTVHKVGSAEAIRVAMISSVIGPGLSMLCCIWRMAWHRMHSHDDIHANKKDSDRAVELQDTLQNTVEQSLLALLVYFGYAAVVPFQYICVLPVSAGFFLVGRVLFARNIYKGASKRALGFIMSHLPSTLLSCVIVSNLIWTHVLSTII